ncbi:MAG: hypothetical protein COB01_08250 [Lutibacter sp.]|nr:MAG: hypothetical protein COB01_08250 [Lutibacter sp.]
MKKDNYSCDYCGEEFIPTRKGVQRFCKSNCRKKYSYHKNKDISKAKPKEEIFQKLEELQHKKNNIEEMSVYGVGNSVAGTLLADGLTAIAKKVFIPKENKPATKRDLQTISFDIHTIIKLLNKRYFQIQNLERNAQGALPYFDMANRKVIYFDVELDTKIAARTI